MTVPKPDDPFARKPYLWGKHCRGPGCDDFNEQHPTCSCRCSACRKPPMQRRFDERTREDVTCVALSPPGMYVGAYVCVLERDHQGNHVSRRGVSWLATNVPCTGEPERSDGEE